MESAVLSRFLKYIAVGTQSQDETDVIPSTDKQRNLARLLVEELSAMDASDVRMDEHTYVCATMSATTDDTDIVVLGLITHMGTSPAYSGAGVNPQIVRQYDDGDILTNPDTDPAIHVTGFPGLGRYVGQDLITTDGSTLLGVDNKAGVAEVIALAGYLLSHPEIRHGTIKIGFTPDEEADYGIDLLDAAGFGADVAYTVDDDELGELEYENFNTASAKVYIHGSNIHPGSSKGEMKDTILMAMEFQSMLPVFEDPMYTEGYEGFYHLDAIEGTVKHARMGYIIRDHDMTKFQEKKAFTEQITDYLGRKHGGSIIELLLEDSYFNMKEKIEPHMYLIDTAKAAMEDMGIEPKVCSIRRDIDDARLPYAELPCPNLCIGGHNFRSKYELISIQSMEHIVELPLNTVRNIGAQQGK